MQSLNTEMEKFEVTILGCGSATPTPRHNPSAQIVNIHDKLSLVDCGEGTQMQMRTNRQRFMALRNVFISHLHGDHCLGLVGLISTFALLGRTKDFHVYAHAELQPLLDAQLKLFCHSLGFEVVFHVVEPHKHVLVYEDRTMEVWSLPLKHSMKATGYLFREKQGQRHINREMTDAYGIPVCYLNNIRAGEDWTMPDGRIIPNVRLTTPADPARSYAYCSDTAYYPALIPLLKGVDLLYHEATYDNSKAIKAKIHGHSTAGQAADIAKQAEVGKLLIGHYSAAYDSPALMLNQAREIFQNTIAADEGLTIVVEPHPKNAIPA